MIRVLHHRSWGAGFRLRLLLTAVVSVQCVSVVNAALAGIPPKPATEPATGLLAARCRY
jgi:hypothetical protein